ncbi:MULTISPECIES: hypothetical protein [unclassified Polynucleobacter]|uniref:hypothetical protein n=1 Tax=unclassified Polynucleobacter TaxID=2640945 RepID=UPI001BFD8806|nr:MULTISPECIES: hypothetical protein [unclassified Polynucleobacter]MBU3605149.1 hypothetical protein [Polynucleobacter sp. MWH-Creno-3A4]QWD77335.1 hypothetical protein C2757_05390 [Polynucleobacter sp. MWH-Svant-W18]
MNLRNLSILSSFILTLMVSGCGSIESAAQDDCTSIGWQIGSKGYEECYKARVYERKLDYSNPPGDRPYPSML